MADSKAAMKAASAMREQLNARLKDLTFKELVSVYNHIYELLHQRVLLERMLRK